MRTHLEAKSMAKSLRAALAVKGLRLSHGECLEIVAKQFGFGEWNMLSAKIDLETGARRPAEAFGVSLQPPVPVVPVSSREKAKAFYLDYLGFAADWGWPSDDDGGPLYAQISRSGAAMHLSERHADRATGIELLIRMSGLDALHAELSSRSDGRAQLAVRHTPDDRREIQVLDPFGNRLRFSENNPPGVSGP